MGLRREAKTIRLPHGRGSSCRRGGRNWSRFAIAPSGVGTESVSNSGESLALAHPSIVIRIAAGNPRFGIVWPGTTRPHRCLFIVAACMERTRRASRRRMALAARRAGPRRAASSGEQSQNRRQRRKNLSRRLSVLSELLPSVDEPLDPTARR